MNQEIRRRDCSGDRGATGWDYKKYFSIDFVRTTFLPNFLWTVSAGSAAELRQQILLIGNPVD